MSSEFPIFRFINFERLVEPPRKEGEVSLKKESITCAASGRGTIFLGDDQGHILAMDRNLKLVAFEGFNSTLFEMSLCRERNILIAVGRNNDSDPPCISLFNTANIDEHGIPSKLSLDVTFDSKFISPNSIPSCIAVTPTMTDVAVGFLTGEVIIVHYDKALRSARQRLLFQKAGSSVSCLMFHPDSKISVACDLGIFVCSTAVADQSQFGIFGGILPSAPPPEDGENICFDEVKLDGVCVTEDGRMAVAKDDSITLWNEEGPESTFALEGKKIKLSSFRNNLIFCTSKQVPDGTGKTVEVNEVIVLDRDNKFISMKERGLGRINKVVQEWGSVFLFTADNSIFELTEKDIQSKLEVFFKRNMFKEALALARNNRFDKMAETTIIMRNAEYLYNKGQFDLSVEEYIRTIGQLEPSFVICKFLDSQHIKELTKYLEKLHERGFANADHTTLLLNCYTKLEAAAKLDEFLRTNSSGDFDVDTAIKVCRQAKYYDHALSLSKKFQKHEWFLKIQLEDKMQYKIALDYIADLEQADRERYLKQFGKILIENIPQETTDLLVDMCTAEVQPEQSPNFNPFLGAAANSDDVSGLISASSLPGTDSGASQQSVLDIPITELDLDGLEPIKVDSDSSEGLASSLIPANLSATLSEKTREVKEKTREVKEKATAFVNSWLPLNRTGTIGGSDIVNPQPLSSEQPEMSSQAESKSAATSVVSMISSLSASDSAKVVLSSSGVSTEPKKPRQLGRSKPEDFIHIFVSRPTWLCMFLERVIEHVENVSSINYDTLLELYLRGPDSADDAKKETEEEKAARKQKVLNLLNQSKSAPRYDRHHALVLCQRYNFDEGVRILLSSLGMYQVILQNLMEKHDDNGVMQTCRDHSSEDKTMWVQALTFFASQEHPNEELIQTVLGNISSNNLMSPLMVLQVLSQNPSLQLATVKNYITDCLERENQIMLQCQREIELCQRETKGLKEDIERLANDPKVFQSSKCSLCQTALSLPTVHFLCGHSFHQRCVGGNEHECPTCATKNKQIAEAKRNLEESAKKHDAFIKSLNSENDGFTVIAEYCGRSIFSCLNDVDFTQDKSSSETTASQSQDSKVSSGYPMAVPSDF